MAWRGGGGGDRSDKEEEDDDDYDEYDPTPYGGGYDVSLTFGRPLPPSDDICYPISSPSSTVDFNRPQHSSGPAASAYYADTDSGDPFGRPRPEPEPEYGYSSGYGERPGSYERPSYEEESGTYGYGKPSYSVQGQGEEYNYNRPKYGDETETEEEPRRGHHKYHHRRRDYDDE